MKQHATGNLRIRVAVSLLAATLAACAADPEARKQRLFESGSAHFERGNFREAIIEFRGAVEADATFGAARVKLAQAYEKVGDAAHALDEYVRAADLLPGDSTVQLAAGHYLLLAGRGNEALARADVVLKGDPASLDAHVLRGNALASLHEIDRALAEMEAALRLDPGRGSTYAQLGLLKFANGSPEAEAAFKRATTLSPDWIDGHLALGNYYWAVGRAADAEAAFQTALGINPAHELTNRAMAMLMLATGRAPAAERYLKVVADQAKTPDASMALAEYYLVAGRYRDAIAMIEPLASPANAYPGSRQRLAQAYAAAGDSAKASALVDEIVRAQPADVEALLLKAQLLVDGGRLEDAVSTVKGATTANPSSAAAQFALGKLYAARGDADGARAAFEAVLKLNPRAAAVNLELARLHLAAGDTVGARAAAEKASRDEPGDVSTRLTLVRTLLASHELTRAAPEIESLRNQYPAIAEVHAQAGILAAEQNNIPAARAAFTRALELDPNSIEGLSGHVALDLKAKDTAGAKARVERRLDAGKQTTDVLLLAARTFAAAGDLDGAERFLRRAIDRESTSLPAYTMLGQLLVSRGKLEEARLEFEALAERQSKPTAALTMTGLILEAQGKTAQAKERYARVLAMDPGAAIAANNLAWLYADSGERLDAALQLAQSATAAVRDVPELMDTLGWVYYKKKLPALAVPLFARCAERAPENPTFHHHLGLAYLQLGDVQKARAALQRALATKPDASTAAEIGRLLSTLPLPANS